MEDDLEKFQARPLTDDEKKLREMRSNGGGFWDRIRKATKDFLPDASPYRKDGDHEFQSRFVDYYSFEVWLRTDKPIPGLVCDFKNPTHWTPVVIVEGYGGYNPSETRYSFDADDEEGVFLRPSRHREKKMSPEQVADEIVSAFLKEYK